MFNKNPKNLQDEIVRMLQMSNFGKKAPQTKDNIIVKKIIKEDFVNDIADLFSDPEDESNENLGTDGAKYTMPIELKAAMLAHTLSEYQAGLLGVYTEWRDKTAGTKASLTPGAVFDKNPEKKLNRLSAEKDRVMNIGKDASVHKPHVNYKREWENIIKSRRVLVTFAGDEARTKDMTAEEKAQSAKWLERKSYELISMSGPHLNPMGKAQLEFLARAFTGKPIDDKEKALFEILNDDGYHFATTAKEILRQFYTLALIPYIMNLTKRAKYNPNDMQLHEFIEEGVDHALYQMMQGKFDPSRGNVGSFIIQVAKNSVKNQLAEISDYKLDLTATHELLMHQDGPYTITSTAVPDEVSDENYASVAQVKEAGKSFNGKNAKAIYAYTYTSPQALIADLTKDARSGKKANPTDSEDLESDPGDVVDKSSLPSPLAKRYLTAQAKQLFYKSFPPTYDEIKDTMGLQSVVDPYDTYNLFKIEQIPSEAKAEIDRIFNKIIEIWIRDDKQAEAIEAANEFRSNRAIRNRLKIVKHADIIKELMFDIFNYGEMVEVYTVAWPLQNSKTKVPVGRPVKYTKDASGKKVPMPNVNGEIPQEGDTEWVWSTRVGLNEFIKPEFANKFIAKMQKKLPPSSKELSYLITHANDIINKSLRAIRYYFGYNGAQNPYIKQNIYDLEDILDNYSTSMQANTKWTEAPKTSKK